MSRGQRTTTSKTLLSSIPSITPQPFQPNQKDDIREHLQNEGWAAVSVVTEDEAADLLSQFWDFIEDLGSGVLRHDPITWGPNQWPEQIRGILKRYGIGQAPFMWSLRTNENVLRVFADLWSCHPTDLLTSFDGACIYPVGAPGGPQGPFVLQEDELWPHRDQAPTRNDLLCVQGSVSLADNRGENDGGLLVWPRTHHIDWTRSDPKARFGREFYRIPSDCIPHRDARVIRVPAGTLLLWDSRTVHANRAPSSGGNTRCVAFICMLDGSSADTSTLMRRMEARTRGDTTSHWPFPFKVNGPGRAARGRADPEDIIKRRRERGDFEDSRDSEIMKSLIGGYLSHLDE
ncbi:hypothetical protein PROFUN_07017 [Planoprotostelium fungivorum]|uniref:Phytanoyl-CoA dioxygenase n=1 Tax=Planoprotostelium fungivorum TaxID=1890364 RepID=A0A2P6NMQ6_9EUKA|nr:hypothetical protein PROFUN_07017 [Planoprotostelium fungivorum]